MAVAAGAEGEAAGVVAAGVGPVVGVRVAVGPGVFVRVAVALGVAVPGAVVGVAVAVTPCVGLLGACVGAVVGWLVAVGEGVPPPLSLSFWRERANAAAIPRPSAINTMPIATRIAVPLTPWLPPGGGAVRRIRAVAWRV